MTGNNKNKKKKEKNKFGNHNESTAEIFNSHTILGTTYVLRINWHLLTMELVKLVLCIFIELTIGNNQWMWSSNLLRIHWITYEKKRDNQFSSGISEFFYFYC